MPDPVVSVVMAVYNMAEHLDTCLTSIVQQSIGVEHLEVIAVDDGSDRRRAWTSSTRGPPTTPS